MYLYCMHTLLSAYGTIVKCMSHIEIHSFINKNISSLKKNSVKLVLWPSLWSVLENVPCAPEKNIFSVVEPSVYVCLVLLVYNVFQIIFSFILSGCFIHYEMWCFKVSHYCRNCISPFCSVTLLHIFWGYVVRCTYVYNRYIYSMDWTVLAFLKCHFVIWLGDMNLDAI